MELNEKQKQLFLRRKGIDYSLRIFVLIDFKDSIH